MPQGIVLGQEFSASHRGWRGEAWVRLERLRDGIDALPASGASGPFEGLEAQWKEAREALDGGEGPDYTWQLLHRLEERIALAARGDMLLEYVSWAKHHVDDQTAKEQPDLLDAEMYKVVAEVDRKDAFENHDQEKVALHSSRLMHEIHAEQDAQHWLANERLSRMKTAAGIMAGLSALIVAATLVLDELPFLLGPDAFPGVPTIQVTALIVLGGLVGGSWGALPALMGAQPDRYRTQRVRVLVRMSMGILAALVGVTLLGAGWVNGLDAGSAPALFAVSLGFGLTQEPLTKALEKKVRSSTEADPSSTSK